MDTTDFAKINNLYESYNGIEATQNTTGRFRPPTDLKNSTTNTWGGLTDPSLGPQMYTPTVEEEVTPIEQIKKLIQQEIDRAPKGMTYAKRVLRKILKLADSV